MEYGVDPRLLGFQKKNEIKIQEDKQLDKFTYTGSKIKNQFTAYILAQIRGARQNYLRKMLRISRRNASRGFNNGRNEHFGGREFGEGIS